MSREPVVDEDLAKLREEHAKRLEQQQEELRKAKQEEQLEDDWFEDRGDRYGGDFLPPEFDQFVPPEIRQRFVAAQREALIGFRALIDYWLDRSGDLTRTRRPRQWEHFTAEDKAK